MTLKLDEVGNTLIIISSVTYYLELRNAITIYYISHFLANKGQIGCLDNIEHSNIYLISTCMNRKKI